MQARWWWFDPKNENEKHDAALRWETLRRTKAYPALWRKWQKEGSVFQRSLRVNSSWPAFFRRAHFDAHAKDAIGVECYQLLCNGFNPRLHWLELPKAQRLEARGFVLHRDEANEDNRCGPELSLPRETSHDHTSVLVGVCEIDRDSNGRLSVKEIKGIRRLTDMQNTEFFQSLNLPTPGRFLYASFDTRLSRDVLFNVLDEWIARLPWLNLAMAGAACHHQVPGCEVHVIPLDQPPYAICLVPDKYGSQGFRAAFHTQLKRDRFYQWHRRCVDYWKTLTFPSLELKMHPDGTPDVECGCLVYETITRCQFNAATDLPPKTNPGKSARRANPWIGLAAHDGVRGGQSLGKKAPLGAFLLGHCESCQELRNHQKSAERRLRELDRSLGRLDKKLSYCIRENAKLDHKGFFTAAADGAAF